MKKIKIGDNVKTSILKHKDVIFNVYDIDSDKNIFAVSEKGFYEIFTPKEIINVEVNEDDMPSYDQLISKTI